MKKNPSFLNEKFFDWTRDITSLANPLVILFVSFIVLGNSPIFYKLLLALIVNEIICSVIKIIFPTKRPTGQTFDSLLQKVDAGSFPSIHTSRITLTYLTLFFNAEQLSIRIVLIIAVLLVMISRILLKKHYWIDVMGGFVIGLLISLTLYYNWFLD